MQQSASTKNLFRALLKAKAEFAPIVKDSVNPHFKSRFADLTSCLAATEPHLHKNGIVVTWPTSWLDGIIVLHCKLVHAETDEFIQGDWPLIPVKNDPQGQGSAMTYGRRYTYLGLIGESAEDDDADAATHKASGKETNTNIATHLKAATVKSQPQASVDPCDDIPPPFDDDMALSPEHRDESAGEFLISFGKFKGKKVAEVDVVLIADYLAFLQRGAGKDGKPLSQSAQDLYNHAKAFSKGVSVEHLITAGIPF